MMTKQCSKKEEGITLLIVLLIGSIILLTSVATGEYALRMVKSIRARGDATQALYTSEQTFQCVKFWLNKDILNFTNQANPSIDPDMDVVCNGYHYNFFAGTDTSTENASADKPSFTTVGSDLVGRFRIPNNLSGGGVVVEVKRGIVSSTHFNGSVNIYSQIGVSGDSKISERFQKYDYSLLSGADVVFVVDRSGSINTGNASGARTPRNAGSQWDLMLKAVTGSIRTLNQEVPAPYVGLLSFGTNVNDVGDIIPGIGIEPDVPLTKSLAALVNDMSTPSLDDDMPIMDVTISATNLSLGIAVAGSELMGKYYPYQGISALQTSVTAGNQTGGFEWLVAEDSDHEATDDDFEDELPDKISSNDRNDAEFPDIIVVISDGVPNAIVTHVRPVLPVWYWSSVFSNNAFIAPEEHDYLIGESKIFRTDPAGSLYQIVDRGGIPSPPLAIVPIANRYNFCNDAGYETPSSYLDAPVANNKWPNYAICNATMIATKLKHDTFAGITFIAILVGSAGTNEAQWFEEQFASSYVDTDGSTKYYFANVASFGDVEEALMKQFKTLTFVESL